MKIKTTNNSFSPWAVAASSAGLVFGFPNSILAAGIQLYEIATPDIGLASAGDSAWAQDASTLFKNPAGMNRLDRPQFQGGLQPTYGEATSFVDGQKVGEGEFGRTRAMIFSADDGCDVGEDSGAAVSPDYGPVGNTFNGTIKGVQLSIADDPNNSDHLVSREDAIRAALGRQ